MYTTPSSKLMISNMQIWTGSSVLCDSCLLEKSLCLFCIQYSPMLTRAGLFVKLFLSTCPALIESFQGNVVPLSTERNSNNQKALTNCALLIKLCAQITDTIALLEIIKTASGKVLLFEAMDRDSLSCGVYFTIYTKVSRADGAIL